MTETTTEKQAILLETYKGTAIRYMPGSRRIAATLEGDDSECGFDSVSAAVQAIDDHEKKLFNAKREVLSLAVLSVENAMHHTITGIHAAHGSVLATPRIEDRAYRGIVPDVSWLRELLLRAQVLEKELNAIWKRIGPYKISAHWDVGNAEKFMASIRGLKESYELARKAALESAPKDDAAKS